MIRCDQFNINEAWIAFRINDEILVGKDGPCDMYVLLDAASGYLFGHVTSKIIDGAPLKKDIKSLIKKAYETKSQWPKLLIVIENSNAERIFQPFLERKGVLVKAVVQSDLESVIESLRKIWPWHWFEDSY